MVNCRNYNEDDYLDEFEFDDSQEYEYYEDDFDDKEADELDDCADADVSPKKSRDRNKSSEQNNRELWFQIMADYRSGDAAKINNAKNKAIDLLKDLVHFIIHQHFHSYAQGYYDDLQQQGYLGISIAFDRYDPSIGAASTYFYYHIQGEIKKYVNEYIQGSTQHYSSAKNKVKKVIAQYEQRGEKCTSVDIAVQTGLPLQTVNGVLDELVNNVNSTISINAHPLDMIEGQIDYGSIKTPAEECIEAEEREIIYKALSSTLSPEAIKIIEYRMGLNGNPVLSFKDIAQKLGIPPERVKRLCSSAFGKLRQNPSLRKLTSEHFGAELHALNEDNGIQLSPMENAELVIEVLKDVEIDY